MPGNADPSRIYRDPALTERRGDPTGPIALLFLLLLVAAFAVVGVLLVWMPAIVADPSPRPAAAATIPPTPRPSATPALTVAPDSTPPPSLAPDPSSPPDATAAPLPTREPQATPTSRPGRATRSGGFGETLPVIIDGTRVGGVTLLPFEVGELPDVELPAGARIMVLELSYVSEPGMAYDASDWVAVDAAGERYPSLGGEAPGDALGRGRLDAGGSITATVAIIRERRVTIDRFVLTDGAGRDLVAVDRDP